MMQPANAYKFRVGDFIVTSLFDTYLQGSFEVITGLEPERITRLHAASRRPIPPCITINAFLLDDGRKKILIDTGFGPFARNGGPRLTTSLASVGLEAEDIDAIVITHIHADHVGGLIDDARRAVFPRAEIFIPNGELDYWSGEPPEGISENQREKFAQAHEILATCDSQITPILGAEVLPGLTRIPLPGHTPDHSGYRLASEGHSVLFWADIVHLPQIQFPQPEATVMFDVDPKQAVRTRLDIFDELSKSGEIVAGAHLDFPGLGYIAREGDSYRFLPNVWSPTV